MTLEQLRKLAARVLDPNGEEWFDDVTEDMADLVFALDDWMRAGGCLPAAWRKGGL